MNIVSLHEICSIVYGKGLATKNLIPHGFPVFGANSIIGYYSEYLYEDEQVLISCRGANSGKVNFSPKQSFITNNSLVLSIKAHVEVSKKFLYYILQGANRSRIVTGTAQPQVTINNARTLKLPLPPLPEQERIVQKIEELFASLDKGIAELEQARARLKVYRQAVLKEAFEGINDFDSISNCSTLVTSGSRGWAQYYSMAGDKFIRIGNLTRETIELDFSNIQYVTLPNSVEGTRSKLQQHDILISITADLGSVAYVPIGIGHAYINQHIALVRLRNPTLGKYYAYFLRSDMGQKDLLKNKRGAGKLGLGLEDIRNTYVPLVTEKKALRTVETLEAKLSACDKQEHIITESLKKAESLRQSILKQAFEGKLHSSPC